MPISSEARDLVQHINRSTHALDDLFAALLDISKLDAGVVDVNCRAFALAPMIERLCLESRDAATDKEIAISARCRSELVVLSDPVHVERILRNLVVNAIRYTKEGRVLIACRRRAGNVRVEIWDTGPGIPSGEQESIFQEYYQLGNPERDRSKGLGLGLAIVRRLATLLGSELTLKSVLGQGSVFALTLPAATTADVSFDMASDTEAPHLAGQTIVVIDDEVEIRIGMSSVMKRWGHEIVTAASGADAVAALADHPTVPDLIIADFRLRGEESGIEAIETLRLEYNARIPAILISGDTAPERLVDAHRSGLVLVHKPISYSRLRAAITNVLLAPHPTDEFKKAGQPVRHSPPVSD